MFHKLVNNDAQTGSRPAWSGPKARSLVGYDEANGRHTYQTTLAKLQASCSQNSTSIAEKQLLQLGLALHHFTVYLNLCGTLPSLAFPSTRLYTKFFLVYCTSLSMGVCLAPLVLMKIITYRLKRLNVCINETLLDMYWTKLVIQESRGLLGRTVIN